MRLYDHLFANPDPDDVPEGVDWITTVNPGSLEVVVGAKVEPALAALAPGASVQFERVGYFTADALHHRAARPSSTAPRRCATAGRRRRSRALRAAERRGRRRGLDGKGNPMASAEVVICGAGIGGVAAAWELAVARGVRDVLLVDPLPPLSLTSDKSTECYRNWWPSAAMVALMNRSVERLDAWAEASGDRFALNRNGYLYLTAGPVWLDREGGLAMGATSLFATPLDWLRLGELVLNRGRVEGKSVVPEAWLREMTTPSAPNPTYGYLIWMGGKAAEQRTLGAFRGFSADAMTLLKADDVVYFDGLGGQRVYVVPSRRLVIVRTGILARTWDDTTLVNLLIDGISSPVAQPDSG